MQYFDYITGDVWDDEEERAEDERRREYEDYIADLLRDDDREYKRGE